MVKNNTVYKNYIAFAIVYYSQLLKHGISHPNVSTNQHGGFAIFEHHVNDDNLSDMIQRFFDDMSYPFETMDSTFIIERDKYSTDIPPICRISPNAPHIHFYYG